MMEDLAAALKVSLANTFVMYFRSHSYHWNVEGHNFSQYHSFLDGLYNELWEAVDPIAEHIRTLDVYAPFSLNDLYSAKTIDEDGLRVDDPHTMFILLLESNSEVIASLNKAYELANYHKKNGLSNFLQDRIDVHEKHGWMLRSFIKGH